MTCIKEVLSHHYDHLDIEREAFNASYLNSLDRIQGRLEHQLKIIEKKTIHAIDIYEFLEFLSNESRDMYAYFECIGKKRCLLTDIESSIKDHCCDECDKNKS